MKAAYCVLTKDHPDVIKEISLNFYAPLINKGFDIYMIQVKTIKQNCL